MFIFILSQDTPSHSALCRDRLSEQASTPDFLESFLPFHRIYYLHEHTAKTIEAHTLAGARSLGPIRTRDLPRVPEPSDAARPLRELKGS